jgi:NADH-quinone oxidoreductase subunit L
VVWLSQPVAAVALFVAVFVTGLYSARATRMTFFDDFRGTGHAHESPASMLIPLVILAVPAALLGFASTWFFQRLSAEPEKLSVPISVLAVALALAGVAIGWVLERGERADEALETRMGWAWRASASAFGYDALVYRVIVGPAVVIARVLWAVVDRYLIDGAVEGSAKVASWLGSAGSDLQAGDAQWYGAAIALGVAVMLAVTIWAGR